MEKLSVDRWRWASGCSGADCQAERDPELADCWATYHLIGDALRKEIELVRSSCNPGAQLDLSLAAILAPRLRLMQLYTARATDTAGVAG
jgi:hypothetical protein